MLVVGYVMGSGPGGGCARTSIRGIGTASLRQLFEATVERCL
jgi:hypothetical protein